MSERCTLIKGGANHNLGFSRRSVASRSPKKASPTLCLALVQSEILCPLGLPSSKGMLKTWQGSTDGYQDGYRHTTSRERLTAVGFV